MHPELTPATQAMALLVADIGDDQLAAPTPCPGSTVADLLDHVGGLCLAFTGAAAKDPATGSQAPSADGSRLDPDWRTRLPERLDRLAAGRQGDGGWGGPSRGGRGGPRPGGGGR